MRIRTILAAGTAALVAGLAAGCGGGTNASGAAGGASLGGGASVAPADTAVFVAIDSDLGSSQWSALDSLLAKTGLRAQLQQGFRQQTGASWDDLESALGPELDVVVLPGAKAQTVLLTQPADASKLDALLAKAPGPKPVTAQIDGWTAVAETQAALEAVSGATRHLADDSLYREATGKLAAGDAFAHVYANGAEAGQLASALGGSSAVAGATQLVWAAADVVAGDGGVKVDGFVRSDGSTPAAQPYASTLVDRIPSGALLVADFRAPKDATTATPANPLAAALGRVADALGGETALYVTPDLPFPAVTLVTQPRDPQAALDAIDQALADAGGAGGSSGGLDLGSLLGGIHLSHEQVGSDLVVSTSQAAIDAFKGGGAKLSADATFGAARSASGMPAQTAGFVYVDLKDALPQLKGMLGAAGGSLSGQKLPDLSALQTLTAYGTGSTNGVTGFTAFLGIG